jgi:hypothetical protein
MPPLPEPMARTPDGAPGLYGVLAAELHLERLLPSDGAVLQAVSDHVWDWLGPHLRWQLSSFCDLPEKLEKEDLEYIAQLTDRLAEAIAPEQQAFASENKRFAYTDYEVSCHGGEDGFDASPFLYEFWAEMSEEEAVEGLMPCDAVVRICVPESWDLGDFYARVTAIAKMLRLRWASAGYSYSFWVPGHSDEVWERMRAHALRHAGYDLALYVRAFEKLNTRLRSVGWLTWLGPSLLDELRQSGRELVSSSLVAVEPAGQGVLLRAGSAPERGDVNRLAYPRSYVEADALVRPVRLADATDLVYYGDWTEDDLTAWLRRFERITN